MTESFAVSGFRPNGISVLFALHGQLGLTCTLARLRHIEASDGSRHQEIELEAN